MDDGRECWSPEGDGVGAVLRRWGQTLDDAMVAPAWTTTDRDSDPVQHAADLEMETCLLYVAATRVRDGLYMTWTGTPSPFLGR